MSRRKNEIEKSEYEFDEAYLRQKEKRKQDRKKRRKRTLRNICILIFLALVITFLVKAPMFNITTFDVEGNCYYTSQEIVTMANARTGGNLFIGADTNDMITRLKKDAFIREVKVKRRLPSTIVIVIDERPQVSALMYGDNYVVLDDTGFVLRKSSVEPKLPVITGLSITKLNIGETIETDDAVLLRQAIELVNEMNKSDMYFVQIEMSAGTIRAHVLQNLTVEGDYTSIVNTLKSGELSLVVSELFNREIERGIITISGDNYISFTPKLD